MEEELKKQMNIALDQMLADWQRELDDFLKREPKGFDFLKE